MAMIVPRHVWEQVSHAFLKSLSLHTVGVVLPLHSGSSFEKRYPSCGCIGLLLISVRSKHRVYLCSLKVCHPQPTWNLCSEELRTQTPRDYLNLSFPLPTYWLCDLTSLCPFLYHSISHDVIFESKITKNTEEKDPIVHSQEVYVFLLAWYKFY